MIIGVAYKKDVDDTRESPAINFINNLKKKNINVNIYDPNVNFLTSRKLSKTYYSKKINKKTLKKYDCVFILTDHSNVNYNLIKKYSKLIVDTRDIYKKKSDKILKL